MICSVLGLGYIGLPIASIIASKGIKTFGIDVNKNLVKDINNCKIHFYEKDLDQLLKKVIKNNYLTAKNLPDKSDVFIITVPTPIFKKSKKPNLNFVFDAIKSIANILEKNNLIIIESTIPVGTTEKIYLFLKNLRKDLNFPSIDYQSDKNKNDVFISHCPERVLPGNIIYELYQNDRIIGGLTKKCSLMASKFYKNFIKGKTIITNAKTAELCKLSENSFRDVNIAFANELSMICDENKVDVWELIKIANLHPRVNILQPGPGVGGHCIAVDPWFLTYSNPKTAKIIKQARLVNLEKETYIYSKIKKIIKGHSKSVSEMVISCFGITFKANVSDLRESPSLSIIKKLLKLPFKKINIVEPNINKIPQFIDNDNVELCSISKSIEQSDILLFFVEHHEFKNINREKLKGKVVLDIKGILNKN
tara:strand:+ start:2037 stop:3302 length:1266 start_codon:yes stop_codon:yes gene_type:complete